jgi:GT2 family glycosyltransferase
MISVLLPTVRMATWRKSAASIPMACGSIPFEVVVISPFLTEPLPSWIHWIHQEATGVTDALEAGMRVARGEWVFSFNDESVMDPESLEKLHAEAVRDPQQILTPEHLPRFPFFYYGKPFAPFPFASRKLLDELGGLVDTEFSAFYADPDLSLRAHKVGIPVREIKGAIIRHENNIGDPAHRHNLSRFLEKDRAVFRQKWDHLGEFCDP